MTTYTIAYVGCGLAGKSTSLLSLLVSHGRTTSTIGNDEHRLCWPTSDCAIVEVVFFVSVMRAWLGHDRGNVQVGDERRRLSCADGLIFVIDSQEARDEANIEHMSMLSTEMADLQRDVQAIPIVFQANKRDLSKVRSMAWIREHFQTTRCTHTESVATKGLGTAEAVDALLKLMAC